MAKDALSVPSGEPGPLVSPSFTPARPRADASALERLITAREAVVGIVGLGYVGLPLALTFNEHGFPILGFDVDRSKVDALNEGKSYITHLDGGRLARAHATERFAATADFARIGEADVVLLCVPTPLTPQREPDMSYVVKTARAVGRGLRPSQLVILESTTYPGTTDELVREILEEESGLTCGDDFFLAYSPEREDPGNRSFETRTIPKVVGGVDARSGDLAQRFYEQGIAKVVRVSSSRAAEATKLVENVFRAVNIALANELKMVFDRMELDVWEILDAASTKPFGFMRFNPGPGWGGHCIPLDPFYLSWKARETGFAPRFIELAGTVNIEMPLWVVEKVAEALNERGKALKGSRVLVLGLAYKKDIDDARESPAFEVIHRLLKHGAQISYHDPHVAVAPRMRSWPHLPEMASQPLTKETLAACDAVVLITDHTAVDYELVARHAPLVVDTRGVYRTARPNVVKA